MILSALIGAVIGVAIARVVVKQSVAKHPPISEQMLQTMMIQMGQKPSSQQLHMMMRRMRKQADQSAKSH